MEKGVRRAVERKLKTGDIKKEARKEVPMKGGEKKRRGEMQRGGKMNKENKEMRSKIDKIVRELPESLV